MYELFAKRGSLGLECAIRILKRYLYSGAPLESEYMYLPAKDPAFDFSVRQYTPSTQNISPATLCSYTLHHYYLDLTSLHTAALATHSDSR